MRTPEEIKRLVWDDPIVQQYISRQRIVQSANRPLILSGPTEALAEKRVAASVAASGKWEVFSAKYKYWLEPHFADLIYGATVIYVNEDMYNFFRKLVDKVEMAYSECKELPEPKPLPFKAMWLTTPMGRAIKYGGETLLDVDASLFVGYGAIKYLESRQHAFVLNFNFEKLCCAVTAIAPGTIEQAFSDAVALMLEEKIASLKPERPNRAIRKLLRSAKIDQNEAIHVLHLREYEHGDVDRRSSEEKQIANYHWRWLVRGHIRNQWFPNKNKHELIWIDPHIKGPIDKPFRETIRAVVR